MSPDLLLTSIVRWVHVVSAVALAGGLLFWSWVLLPAARETPGGQGLGGLSEPVARRWRLIVMASTALLLLSGFYNFFTVSFDKAADLAERGTRLYHPIFGIKFLASIGVFFLSSALCGRSKAFEAIRSRPERWMSLNAALVVLVILLGGILKSLE